jgi:hypothetical protein
LVVTPEKSSRLPRPPEIDNPKIGQNRFKMTLSRTAFRVIPANGRGRRVLIFGVVQAFFPAYLAPTQGVANFKNLLRFT